MKKLLLGGAATLTGILTTISTIASPAPAMANPNRLIDDNIFTNNNTMDAREIDEFLNRFPKSCISTNNGFSARKPTGYSQQAGYSLGELVSAGTVIKTAADAYGINPQVLLTTLQKEQSLVTGTTDCDTKRYAASMGYSCPDNVTLHTYTNVDLYASNNTIITSVPSTCVNQQGRAGFSQQIIRAAWMLKHSQQRALGNTDWVVVDDTWNNADDLKKCYGGYMTAGDHRTCPNGSAKHFDGTYTIDGQEVVMETGATAALYRYTPHIAGNKLFMKTFERWFGPSVDPQYSWELVDQASFTDSSKTTARSIAAMQPEQRAYVVITVKNTSNFTWNQDSYYPIKLGTLAPKDHDSPFCADGWLSCSRPATFAQETVAPGETATFSFWYQAPKQSGVHQEHLSLVADGKRWLPDQNLTLTTTVK